MLHSLSIIANSSLSYFMAITAMVISNRKTEARRTMQDLKMLENMIAVRFVHLYWKMDVLYGAPTLSGYV
uniref:Uncharacterized protein n=1 Tax=Helianthus annuus TaxID=4232 RepID=A0A251TIG8_HELAN